MLAAVFAAPPVWWLLAPIVGETMSVGIVSLLAAAVLYPVLEELCFRGLLQGWLLEQLSVERRPWGISLPNLLTSFAFAAAHSPMHSIAWASATLVPSLVFGHLRERYDSVWAPIALHIYYNAGLFLFAMYVR